MNFNIDIQFSDNEPLEEGEKALLFKNISVLQELIMKYELVNRLPKEGFNNLTQDPAIRIIFCSDETIRQINTQFRGIDSPTDVITFPFEMTQSEENFPFTPESEIYVSLDTAAGQAGEQGHSFIDELLVLIVHGICHAFGMDHEKSEEEADKMRAQEAQFLKDTGLDFLAPLTQ